MINCAPYLAKMGLGCKKCESCFGEAYKIIEELKSQLKDKDCEIENLEKEIYLYKDEVDDLEDDINRLEEELYELKEKK